MTWQTVSTSSASTEKLAAAFGSQLKGGEVVELVSDLGGGKTTFVRGMARGMGSSDAVGSPSFTLSREYKAGSLTLYHFDFYRLQEPGLVANELAEVTGDPQAVVVVEWADIVEDVLPPERVTIRLQYQAADQRLLTFYCPQALAYTIPEAA